MRTLTRLTMAALATLLVLVAAAPNAQAACATLSPIGTVGGNGSSFIWTEGQFSPSYYAGYPPLMYSADAAPPVTAAFTGVFWKQGTGDPTAGLGDDSGSYDWTNAGGFYYAAYPPSGPYYGYYSAASIFATWSGSGVDGCIGTNACDCVLMTDVVGNESRFAIAGALAGATGTTDLSQPGNDGAGNAGPIVLVPVPGPMITGSVRDAGTFDASLTVMVPAAAGGVYVKDGCNCGPTGYKVLQQVLARGSMPPSSRNAADWTEPALDAGGAQPVTPLGGSVTIRSLCGASDTDVYLTTQLFFDSNFSASVVSGNSTRVECGTNLADPAPIKPERPRPGRAGKPSPRNRR